MRQSSGQLISKKLEAALFSSAMANHLIYYGEPLSRPVLPLPTVSQSLLSGTVEDLEAGSIAQEFEAFEARRLKFFRQFWSTSQPLHREAYGRAYY